MNKHIQKALERFREKFFVKNGEMTPETFVDAEQFLKQELENAYNQIYSEINDGIFDEVSYSPREGYGRSSKDTWWAGVDDVCEVVSKRLDSVREKYNLTNQQKNNT